MAKEKQSVKTIEGELLRDLLELTSRQFVYEDGWCGMVPFDGELTELQSGPPVPFAELTWREQADVLRSFIPWSRYPEATWDDEYTIRQNIAAGKRPEQWLEGTKLGESFRLLDEGKTPSPPKEFPGISEQDIREALGMGGADTYGAKAEVTNVQEQGLALAKAFQDILRNDQQKKEGKTEERGDHPKQKEAKTKDNGREI